MPWDEVGGAVVEPTLDAGDLGGIRWPELAPAAGRGGAEAKVGEGLVGAEGEDLEGSGEELFGEDGGEGVGGGGGRNGSGRGIMRDVGVGEREEGEVAFQAGQVGPVCLAGGGEEFLVDVGLVAGFADGGASGGAEGAFRE